ncbi:MAG: hypothetical protein ACOH2N_18735 [Devosia sp.]
MSKRNRSRQFAVVTVVTGATIFTLVGFLIWDAAASYTSNSLQAERYSDRYSANTKQEISAACPAPASAECIVQIIEATHENQRAEADLNAQRDMAKWAFLLLIISTVGTLIGGFGLFWIRETLGATRKGNKINRRIGEAQVRAYLGVSDVEGLWEGSDGPGRWAPSIYITASITNGGVTPAKHVAVSYKLVRLGDTKVMDQVEDLFQIEDIMPGANPTFYAARNDIRASDAAVLKGCVEPAFAISGNIRYFIVGSPSARTVRFNYEIIGRDQSNTLDFIRTEQGNEAD